MFNCGRKHRNKSDISKVANMATVEGHSDGGGDGGGGGGTLGSGGVSLINNTSVSNNSNNTTNTNSNTNNASNNRRTFQRFSCSRCCNDLFTSLLRLRVSPEELEQRYKSREIDKFLEKDKYAFRRQVKEKKPRKESHYFLCSNDKNYLLILPNNKQNVHADVLCFCKTKKANKTPTDWLGHCLFWFLNEH